LNRSRSRVSRATLFFLLLSIALGIALYIKTRPSPVERAPAPRLLPSPRPAVAASPRPRLAPSPQAIAPTPAEPGGVPSPRVSIVIDDLGNDMAAASRIAGWRYPVCGAVLPSLPGSERTARELEESGKQVLLHLPMEPRRYPQMRPGPGVVLLSQSEEEIARTVEGDLETVPGVAGVSNHMGSAATADARVMRAVARVLARRGLFFLDSRTTGLTVAREAAREEHVPAVSRRVFLDDVATEEAVQRSLDELLAHARSEGFAVGLGHPYPATLAVLERELPRLGERGVKLVPVGELAK
jgi:uncharacterized protein